MHKNQWDAALEKCLKLLKLRPSDIDLLVTLAQLLKNLNRIEECQGVLTHIVNIDANNGPALSLVGQVLLAHGQLSEANERFIQASQLYEGDQALFFSWGKALVLLGFHDQAIEKFSKAAEIDPYDGDTYEAWGQTLKRLGRFAEAAEVFKRAQTFWD